MVLRRQRRKPAAASGPVAPETPALGAPEAVTRPDVGSTVGDVPTSSAAEVGVATATAVQETVANPQPIETIGGVTVKSMTQVALLGEDLKNYRALPEVCESDAAFFAEHGPKDVMFELWFSKRFPFWKPWK